MGHLLCVAKMTFQSQEMRNTFYIGGNDAVMANAQTIIDEIADAYDTNLGTWLSDDWNLYGFDVYDKTIPSVPGIEYTPTGGTVSGSNVSGYLPAQIALLVTFKAAVSPPNTNRKYVPGFTVASTSDGLFVASVLTAAGNWADQLLDLATGTSLAVVYEVVALNQLDGTVTGGNPLETAVPKAIPATQRRRRINVGI